jgi:hypothetical protein
MRDFRDSVDPENKKAARQRYADRAALSFMDFQGHRAGVLYPKQDKVIYSIVI